MEGTTTVTLYDGETGEIVGHLEGQSDQVDLNLRLSNYPHVLGFFNNQCFYVNNGEPSKRPNNPVNLEGLLLRDVPPNSEITIENETYPCPDGGDVTLNFQHPGTYIVTIKCFPYLDKEFEIDYQP